MVLKSVGDKNFFQQQSYLLNWPPLVDLIEPHETSKG